MKRFSILTISTIAILMFGITACGEKVSNNLGGATRGNGAYDYNYDYSGTDTNGNNMLNRFGFTNSGGAGYWDYYGITNGSANDSMRNDLVNNYNTSTTTNRTIPYNTANTMIGTTNTANTMLDSATVTNYSESIMK